MSNSFTRGFTSPINAVIILKNNKGFLKYFILPFLINIILLSSVFYFSYTTIDPWLSGLLDGDSMIFTLLRMLLKPLIVLILAIVTVFIYSVIGNIITAPFNDLISRRVESLITGQEMEEKFSIKEIPGEMSRIAGNIFIIEIFLKIKR